MTRRPPSLRGLQLATACAMALATVSCVSSATRGDPSVTIPRHRPAQSSYRLAQLDFGPGAAYAVCAAPACPTVTPKTRAGASNANLSQPMPGAAQAIGEAPPVSMSAEPTGSTAEPVFAGVTVRAATHAPSFGLEKHTAAVGDSEKAAADAVSPHAFIGVFLPPDTARGLLPRPSGERDTLQRSPADSLPLPPARDPAAPSIDTTAAVAKIHRAETIMVRFPSGGIVLTPPAKQALERAIPFARRADRIVIVGRTDNRGTEEINDRVALTRAMAVREFIRSSIPDVDNTIVVDAKGACCYVASNDTAQGQSENRRVVVVFNVPDPPSKSEASEVTMPSPNENAGSGLESASRTSP